MTFLPALATLILCPLDVVPPPPAPSDAQIAETRAHAKEAVERALIDADLQMKVGLHTPWHIVHGVLAYADRLRIQDRQGKPISALEWIKEGGIWRDQPSFMTSPTGFRGNPWGPAFQGHIAQFAGYISELELPKTTPFRAWNVEQKAWQTRPLSALYDDLKGEVAEANQEEGKETSWALWALARDPATTLEELEPLVAIEAGRDTWDAPCGGFHGLYALSLALKRYRASGKPLEGTWLIADFVERTMLAKAKKYQNEDGSFSADYLSGRAHGETWRDQLPGNGHTLEWLMLVLPDAELKTEWVLNGVGSVATNLLEAEISDRDVEAYLDVMDDASVTDEKKEELFERYMTLGGYFHAAHGLEVFLRRTAR